MENSVGETPANKQLGIGFGALSPTIAVQLKKQGFKYNPEKVKEFQKLREYITYLMFADILNHSECDKATKKLFSKIRQHVAQQNKLKTVK